MSQLFENLSALASKSEAFYPVDQEIDGVKYRIFLYRIASYSDFLLPDALESRGSMFRINSDGTADLVCRPMQKFFNLNECPFTMNLDISKASLIVDKVDGSLISSYVHRKLGVAGYEKSVRLKTKGSLFSEQAESAMGLLAAPAFEKLRRFVDNFTLNLGYTVNMEFTSPFNRIVIGYEKPSLTVLNVRSLSGEYLDYEYVEEIMRDYGAGEFLVKNFMKEYQNDVPAFINSVPDMTGIEGFVVTLPSGLTFKLKTRAYIALHHAKDSINSQRRLFEAVVAESADDLRSLFVEDPVSLKMIDEMQERVSKLYNNMVKSVEDFYATNKNLDRKSYAIKGQNELDRKYFSLAMMKYLGKPVDFKGFMIKSYKDFGIKDDAAIPTE